jgi:hypothetical protein
VRRVTIRVDPPGTVKPDETQDVDQLDADGSFGRLMQAGSGRLGGSDHLVNDPLGIGGQRRSSAAEIDGQPRSAGGRAVPEAPVGRLALALGRLTRYPRAHGPPVSPRDPSDRRDYPALPLEAFPAADWIRARAEQLSERLPGPCPRLPSVAWHSPWDGRPGGRPGGWAVEP